MHIAAMASFEIAGDAGIPSLDALRSLLAKRG